jgi:NitT/TauT family transport system permease protein
MTPLADSGSKTQEAPARPCPAHDSHAVRPWLWDVAAAVAPPALFCILLAAGWEAMAVLNPSPLLPRLAEIGEALTAILTSGDAARQIGITLGRIAAGFAAAYVIAIAVGLASARSRAVERFFEPALVLGLTVPGLVWALLCVIWFGLSLTTSVVAIAAGIAPALALSIVHGLHAVDPQLVEAAHVYRLSFGVRLRYLWLPAILPFLLSGARLGFSLAWKVVVLVEIFGLSSGVGYRLNSAFSAQNVADVMAWTTAFAVVMAVIEYGPMQLTERRLTRWKRVARV